MSADPSPSTNASRSAPLPWLSVGLVIACLAATIHVQRAEGQARASLDQGLAEAEAYLLEHPYLEPGPLLEARVSMAAIDEARAEHRRERRARGALPTPSGVARRQQETLDGMLVGAGSAVERLPTRRLGLVAAEPRPSAFLSHGLVHTRGWPLLGNAVLLLLLGAALERVWGRWLYGVGVLAVTAASGALFVQVNPLAQVPLVGASGLLAGLLAAFAVHYGSDPTRGFYLPILAGGLLWLVLPAWLGLPWSLESGGASLEVASVAPQASLWALVGGAFAGLPLALGVRLLGLDTALGPRGARSGGHPLYDRAIRAQERGRPDEAFALARELLAEVPGHGVGALLLWELATELQRRNEAVPAFVRLVRDALQQDSQEAAVEYWLTFTVDGVPEGVDATLSTRMALVLHRANESGAALGALRAALERAEADNPVVASRVAHAARDLDPQTAEEAAWRALGSMELGLEERTELENLIAEVMPETSRRGDAPWQRPERIEEAAVPNDSEPEVARPVPIDLDVEERQLEVVSAVPLELTTEGVGIRVADQNRCLGWERVQAVSVAAVEGLGPKPVLVVDLVLNWMTTADEKLRVVRLRGDRFDPRRVVPGQASAVAALRVFIDRVLERSGAVPLPDRAAALGQPFASFESLGLYQTTVLMVEDAADDGEKPE